MSLKSSLVALANNIGMCQENARSIKQALLGGLTDVAASTDDAGLSIDTIWSNADTTASFAGQTVEADITGGYSAFIVSFGTTSGVIEDTVIAFDGVTTRVADARLGSDGKVYQANRDVTITVGTGVISAVFTSCTTLEATALGSSLSWVTHNNSKVPYAIYGIR